MPTSTVTQIWSSLVAFSRTPGYGYLLPVFAVTVGLLIFSLLIGLVIDRWVLPKFYARYSRESSAAVRQQQDAQQRVSDLIRVSPDEPLLNALQRVHQASLAHPAAKGFHKPNVVDLDERRQQLSAAIGRDREQFIHSNINVRRI